MRARVHACTHTHNWLQTPCNYGTTFLRIFRERSPSQSCRANEPHLARQLQMLYNINFVSVFVVLAVSLQTQTTPVNWLYLGRSQDNPCLTTQKQDNMTIQLTKCTMTTATASLCMAGFFRLFYFTIFLLCFLRFSPPTVSIPSLFLTPSTPAILILSFPLPSFQSVE